MKKYKEINYIVHWNEQVGSYCGYVRIPDDHKYTKLVNKTEEVFGMKLHTGYDDMDIDCHGGLTYCKRHSGTEETFQGFTEGAWVGWDYSHYGDKTVYFDGKTWSEEEVEQECKNVIEQLSNPSK